MRAVGHLLREAEGSGLADYWPDDVWLAFGTEPVVYLQQHFLGIPVHEARRQVRLSAAGEVRTVKGDAVPVPEDAPTHPLVSAPEAVLVAANDLLGQRRKEGHRTSRRPARIVCQFAAPARPTLLRKRPFKEPLTAHLALFPQGGRLRLAWVIHLILPRPGEAYELLVAADAAPAEVLRCRRTTACAGFEGLVFDFDPDTANRVRHTFPRLRPDYPALGDATPPGFPWTWCPTGATRGNNTHCFVGNTSKTFKGTEAGGVTRFEPADNRGTDQRLLNAFYVCNLMHGLSANVLYNWNGLFGKHYFDVSPALGVALGTLQTFPAAGATVRVGWNMTGFPVALGSWTAARADARKGWEIGFFAGADGRYFLRNGYFDGNIVGGEPSVDKTRGVYDLRYGGFLRIRDWRLTYTLVRRSREFAPTPPYARAHHNFGSVSLSRERAGAETGPTGTQGFFRRDWILDLGLGYGLARLLPEQPLGQRTTHGPAGRVGLEKGITEHLLVGAMMAGVVREGGPPDRTGTHRDTFLLTKAVTVGLRPFGRPQAGDRGALHLRAGVGQGAGKVELTVNGVPDLERTDTGLGLLAGVEYSFRLGHDLSLGVDATWSTLRIDKDLFDRARFLSTCLAIQWRP